VQWCAGAATPKNKIGGGKRGAMASMLTQSLLQQGCLPMPMDSGTAC